MNLKLKILVSAFLILSFISCSNKAETGQLTDQEIESRIEQLVSQMTLKEKVSLLHGNSKFTVAGIERLGIPALQLSDGPHGVRQEISKHSWDPAGWTTDSSTYFPTGTALAATWNPALAKEFGQALGEEARARNKDIMLGPGINIMRTPLCGRNFEYMGEDPYLISEMVVEVIKGMQSRDVAACIKHYALNNQEVERDRVNVEVDERTLREIYLPGFEAAVKEAGVLSVMGAYNKFRGDYLGNNAYLLNDVLKTEWGFSGVVLSDWDAVHNTVESANNGMDLEMGTSKDSYDDYYFADPLIEAVQNGEVQESVVDDKVSRILRLMFKTKMFSNDRHAGSFNTREHQLAALKVAQEAVVLLKNDNGFLPLDKSSVKSIAVIGDNATRKHSEGGHSSAIKAKYEITPLQGLKKYLGEEVKINYALGYEKTTREEYGKELDHSPDPVKARQLIKEAVQVAAASDMVLIFGGLNHDFDTEGKDRKHMKLPYTQDELIRQVYKANPNTAVILISGSPVEMHPWIESVPAVVQMWFAGMEGGTAISEILFGDVNPSGKLPFTFPVKLEDSPAHKAGNYPGENLQVNYEEGILVGYRYFDTENVAPLFPFGHGLSYTEFEYSDLKISQNNGEVLVKLSVKNTGAADGAEIVQLYIRDEEASVPRPDKELKGFQKLFLKAGQTGQVEFRITSAELSFYDVGTMSWKAEKGDFEVLLGSSSRDIRLSAVFTY